MQSSQILINRLGFFLIYLGWSSLTLHTCYAQSLETPKPVSSREFKKLARSVKRDRSNLLAILVSLEKSARTTTRASVSSQQKRALSRLIKQANQAVNRLHFAAYTYYQRPRSSRQGSTAHLALRSEIWKTLSTQHGQLFRRYDGRYCLAPHWRLVLGKILHFLGRHKESQEAYRKSIACGLSQEASLGIRTDLERKEAR